jgi:hypothetical protein
MRIAIGSPLSQTNARCDVDTTPPVVTSVKIDGGSVSNPK